jgi:serine/threonine-protein kinase HipA
MSVGRNRHYAIHDIVPRHFMQSADLSGVGTPAMKAIFEDITANAEQQAEAAITKLPNGFPDQLVTSTMAAINHRVQLVADSLSRASHV